jgi:hypothetical protein
LNDIRDSKEINSLEVKPHATSFINQTAPQRYEIVERENKRILICLEAPNIEVHVEAGLTVSSSAARKSHSHTIYLDGVVNSEPFLDLEKQIYNFDHHEGCLRPFTLSTCEQVLVMILKGLDLRGPDWSVFANDPDLDTILAIWLIFNHVRIQQKEFGALNRLCALVRLEGIIDSHGLEMEALSGFHPKTLLKTKQMINYLRAEEVDLKSKGIWTQNDFLEHTALILHKVDRIIYKADELTDFKDLKELSRIDLGNSRIAVAVETKLGVYDLEPYLTRLYGESLGLVILRKEQGTYTLRIMDPFMPGDLNAVYKILNFIDPAVRGRSEGNKWGGSSDIGGSPRGNGGTRLDPQEIANACKDAFHNPDFSVNVIRFIFSLIITSTIIGISIIISSNFLSNPWLGTVTRKIYIHSDLIFFISVIFFTVMSLNFLGRKRPWQFGLAAPVGKSWLILFPLVITMVIGIGIYFPYKGIKLVGNPETAYLFIVAIPLASELLFRSLIHGLFVNANNIQGFSSHWFISFPSVVAAILYSVYMVTILMYPASLQNGFQAIATIECLAAALVLGLLSGLVRERSQSVFPVILSHGLGISVLIGKLHLA